MDELFAVSYDSEFKADEVRTNLLKLEKEYLIDLDDAVVAIKKSNGKIKIRQMHHTAYAGAAEGGFWGLLIGLIFSFPLLGIGTMLPLLGFAFGASAGAITGALANAGVDKNFMKEVAESLKPGSSILFILVRKENVERVVPELENFGGKIIRSSLTHTDEERLRAAIGAGTEKGSETETTTQNLSH